jgi:hypothetical protein
VTFEQFQTLDPEHADMLSPELAALALDRAGRWEAAHERASKVETLQTNRVHAYLHRKEGDLGNARYWYARVGEAIPEQSLDDEWSVLARRFLAASPARNT